VDEFLTEKEQIEQIRNWWRENGWYLIGGMALAAVGYLGWNQYQAYRDNRAEQASSLFVRLQQTVEDDRAGADELLAQLIGEFPSSAYADQARLLMASKQLISDPNQAATYLREVMEDSRDPGLAFIARLRLARVLAYQQSYDAALEVLDVAEPGEFAARVSELKGDVYAAMGNSEAARSAYSDALSAAGTQSLDRNFVQMKLNDLPLAPDAAAATEG
jgi:predicted negative regulator of RcsB-dependent stress response